MLARPFGRHIAQPDNSHSVRKPSINGCLDEIGREEGKRDCHVHPSHTATFAICDELSLNLGDGLRIQAAAVWDFEDAELAATSIPSVNRTP